MMTGTSIYLGTVLLEANRWTPVKTPTYRVSDWAGRIRDAGFDGVELWQNHYALAEAGERDAVRRSGLKVPVFNSYVTFDAAGADQRREAAAWIRELGATAVKFNVDHTPATLEQELRAVEEWGRAMPGVTLLCECHPSTSLEEPDVAAEALADHPDIAVIVHPFSRPGVDRWLRHFGPRVRHAHVQMPDEQWRWWRLRDRAGFVRERLAMMREGGFAGSFTIEFTAGVAVPPEDREALFASAVEDMAFLREAW